MEILSKNRSIGVVGKRTHPSTFNLPAFTHEFVEVITCRSQPEHNSPTRSPVRSRDRTLFFFLLRVPLWAGLNKDFGGVEFLGGSEMGT